MKAALVIAACLLLHGAVFAQAAPQGTPGPMPAPGVKPVDVPDTMGQRMQACTACHGKEGRATNAGYFPRIAGKPAGYLFNQLVSFREERRHNTVMAALLAHMSDDYLREIAQYFASLDLPYPPPAPTAAAQRDLARGEAIVRQGNGKVPACVQCHGSAMTGVAPTIPGLLGLPSGYMSGELNAWRTGARKAVEPDCMAQIARELTADEIGAAAAWLATQPVPPNAKPAASIALPLPRKCGSGLP